MLFLNMGLLFGLLAVSIPVLIHLFNRKAARVVDWGAMQFLLDSLISRRRKILLEEVLLLAARCMLLTLLALAMARPFISATSRVPWVVVMPMILVASSLFAVSFAFWRSPRLRWSMLFAGLGLVLLVALIVLAERQLNLRRFGGKGRRDVALVIDGSMSMTMVRDGKSNFQRAKEEAEELVRSASHKTAFTLVVAGSGPQVLIPAPVTDRNELIAALDDAKPPLGTMRIVDALAAAAVALAQGDNPAKQIVVLTDGQRAGWDLDTPWRWQFLAQTLSHLPVPPQIIVRRLDLPASYRNAAIGDLQLSRRVVGLDRDVGLTVRIVNTGTEAITPSDVTVSVDGRELRDNTIGQILPDASETVNFSFGFRDAGTHVANVRLGVGDELAADNAASLAVNAVTTLRVLLVDGNPAGRFLDRASAFAQLALSPSSAYGTELAGAVTNAAGWQRAFLVQPTVMDALQASELPAFDDYDAVLLADVPRLPAEAAARLAEYVRSGGGLFVAPGARASSPFYNDWKTAGGAMLMPAFMQQWTVTTNDAEALSPSLSTFSHPALAAVADPDHSDLDTAQFLAFWKLAPWEQDTAVNVGARLTSGDPWLVERKVGGGLVVLLAGPLDNQGGNLATRQSFLPLVHEAVYHLASAGTAGLNVDAGTELALRLPRRAPGATAVPAQDPKAGKVELDTTIRTEAVAPDGTTRSAGIRVKSEAVVARVDGGVIPGLYMLKLPALLKPALGWLASPDGSAIPFTVKQGVDESRLAGLTETDHVYIRQFGDFLRADSPEDAASAIAGKAFGREIWRSLAFPAFLLLLIEILLTRWIAVRRRTGSEREVDFESQQAPSATFREQLRALRGS